MIELCKDCEYSVLIADLIATLMTYDKYGESFVLKVWYTNTEIPFTFESQCHFDFLQEGLRVDDGTSIKYLFYDLITSVEVFK